MEEMTASELLREADSHPCSMCHLVMSGDESCATTGCASWAYRLADKIDAELAEARELSLRRGAELWAKANGWPDFKDGEDFGAWLERCALPRPRFEDGEPVHIGDKAYHPYTGETCTIDCINTFDDSYCLGFIEERSAALLDGERVKRPAPEVLGADGQFALAVHDRRAWQRVRKCEMSPARGGGWYCSECSVWVAPGPMANATEHLAPRYCPNCGAKVVG